MPINDLLDPVKIKSNLRTKRIGRKILVYIGIENGHGSFSFGDKRGDNTDNCCLSCTIGAKEAEKFALLHIQGDTAERFESTFVRFVQIIKR